MSEPSRDPLRLALRALTHGVYVLGISHNGREDYLIVSLVAQCSVEPPRISFCVSNKARLLGALREEKGGVLAILAAESAAAVRRYGIPGGVRNFPENPKRSASGHPICPEAAAWLAFRTHDELSVGDHVLFVADVVEAGTLSGDTDALQALAPMTLRESGFPYAG